MSNPKKIVFATSNMNAGGAQRRLSIISNYLIGLGYDVYIVYTGDYISPSDYPLDSRINLVFSRKREKGFFRNIIEKIDTKGYLRYYYRLIRLHRIIKEINPQAIVIFKSKPLEMLTSIFRNKKIPLIYSVVRTLPESLDITATEITFLNKCFTKLSGIVFQTESQQKRFNELTQISSQIIQTVIQNPAQESPYWYKPKITNSNTIVSCGRLVPIKDFQLLIKAFSRIHTKYPEWKLIIYGEGRERTNLEHLVEELKLTDSISLPGRVDDVDNRLHQAEIFTLTSTNEGLPNALIEAMCMGLACISTNFDNAADTIIDNERNGIIIPVGDEEALYSALERLIVNKDFREEISENAKELRNTLSEEKIINQWIEYINTVVNKDKVCY